MHGVALYSVPSILMITPNITTVRSLSHSHMAQLMKLQGYTWMLVHNNCLMWHLIWKKRLYKCAQVKDLKKEKIILDHLQNPKSVKSILLRVEGALNIQRSRAQENSKNRLKGACCWP